MTYRPSRAIELTPWVRNAAGDTSGLRLPKGYLIVGDARRPTGPYLLRLYRPSLPGEATRERVLMEQPVTLAAEVGTWLEVLVNLAFIHEREQSERVVVTTDRDGWIESIETEGSGA